MTLADTLDYCAAVRYVNDLASLGSRPGFERIRALCKRLGDPQDSLKFIHIAGTNGKGSTAAFISSSLACSGVKVGMYYSPALSGITDHYMINGEPISEQDYAECVSEVARANDRIIDETKESATQFEFETAVAFVCFCKNHCDAVVLECGMGGRDDATNIVRNKICCVFASISFDHMQYLGNTLSEIADVKSGIITSDCPVIAFDSSDESTGVIERRCEETGSSLHIVKAGDIKSVEAFPLGQTITYKEHHDISVCLNGTFQSDNAALALETIDVISKNHLIPGAAIDEDTVREGMKKARWPYRFECINKEPLVFVDGAHNADAAKRLSDSIREYLPGYNIILVMGVFADKEYDKVAALLAPLAKRIFTVETPDNPRALPAAELAKCASKYCKDVRACESIEEACKKACKCANAAVVACGSLSYLKEFSDRVYELFNE